MPVYQPHQRQTINVIHSGQDSPRNKVSENLILCPHDSERGIAVASERFKHKRGSLNKVVDPVGISRFSCEDRAIIFSPLEHRIGQTDGKTTGANSAIH
jgi:hypothetical protein